METTPKVAIVTGAGSGIGRASAHILLGAGYRVVLAGRRADALEAAGRESGAPADHWLAVPTDVADEQSVAALFARTKEKFGRLDVLFNNAGTNAPGVPIDELPVEKWREVIDINLTGVFLCAREAFRLMKQQQPTGGRIINNGSISAHVPRPNSSPYTASKHGVSGLTKALGLDGRLFNISVAQIDIGNADTAMAGKMKKGVPQANGTTAIEPTMDVKHVAEAVLYIANLPLDVNVPTITVMAAGMPYLGRG